jgi:hypothetical protein
VIRETSLLPPFIPLRVHAKWANGLLLANVGVCWVAVGVGLAELRLLMRATGGNTVAPIERAAQFTTNEWLAVAQAVLFVATGVAFLMWLYQARVNIRALGVRRPRFGSDWAYLAFLVPLLNLFRPYQVVREIWQASDPQSLDPFNWKSAAVSPLVPLWWGLFAAFLGVATLTWLTALGAGMSLARLELTTMLTIVANVFAACAAGAAALLVTRIGDAQEAKYARQLASEEEKPECDEASPD